MKTQRIAVYADEGTRHALDVLGFDYEEVGRTDVNNGVVEGYDLFLNRNNIDKSVDLDHITGWRIRCRQRNRGQQLVGNGGSDCPLRQQNV